MGTEQCPKCNNPIQPGWIFCDSCGWSLSSVEPSSEQPSDSTPASIPTPQLAPYPGADQIPQGYLTGTLVVQNGNISIVLPQDRSEVILGREDSASNVYPDIDLEPYGGHQAGVGRLHARLVMNAGQLYLFDLNSVNGSYINRQKVTPESPQPIQDGDEIRLGRVKLIYHANSPVSS